MLFADALPMFWTTRVYCSEAGGTTGSGTSILLMIKSTDGVAVEVTVGLIVGINVIVPVVVGVRVMVGVLVPWTQPRIVVCWLALGLCAFGAPPIWARAVLVTGDTTTQGLSTRARI